jgi:hypothetical protein
MACVLTSLNMDPTLESKSYSFRKAYTFPNQQGQGVFGLSNWSPIYLYNLYRFIR